MPSRTGPGLPLTDPYIQRRATLALFFGASVWGLYWVPLRELDRIGLEGGWAVALFNVCPLLILMPLVIWNRRTALTNLGPALFIGAATGIGLGLYSTSIVLAPVIRMTMEFYLTSVWSTIIGVIWLSEKLDLRRIVTVTMGLFGLFLLLTGGSDLPEMALGQGDVMAVASGMLWALGAAGMKRWPEAHVLTTSAFQFAFAVLTGVLLTLVLLSVPVPETAQMIAALPLSFAASNLLLLPSILAIFWACRVLFPGRAAILMMSEALVATISASLLLPEETMTGMQWSGGAIVLLACLFGR
jgi:drug/metabolite transporter (DMT)-like permease